MTAGLLRAQDSEFPELCQHPAQRLNSPAENTGTRGVLTAFAPEKNQQDVTENFGARREAMSRRVCHTQSPPWIFPRFSQRDEKKLD
jgi:hypothetical protein